MIIAKHSDFKQESDFFEIKNSIASTKFQKYAMIIASPKLIYKE